MLLSTRSPMRILKIVSPSSNMRFSSSPHGQPHNMLQVGGGDLNTQVNAFRGVSGRYSKGERHADKERARIIYGFLGVNAVSLENTFHPGGFTRFPTTGRADSRPSQIDFFIASTRFRSKPLDPRTSLQTALVTTKKCAMPLLH